MKITLNFWRKRKKPLLSTSELELLCTENKEARKGAMSPFGISGGADSSTKALGVGYTVSGPTAIIGTPLSEENHP